jgi:hypothetical protein
MHYSRSGSVGEGSNGMAGGPGSQRQHGSAGSSPDFAGGYDSTEYTDSPPDSTNRGPTTGSAYAPHAYTHTPPSIDASYAGGPVVSGGSYHPSPYATTPGGAYGPPGGHETAYNGAAANAGFVTFDGDHHEASGMRSYSMTTTAGSEYVPGPNRGYSSNNATWRSPTYPFTTSR